MYRIFEARDTDAMARAQSLAFGIPLLLIGSWWDLAGRDNIRVWDDGAVRGGLIDIPMGMYFGGRSVPTHGVAGVTVAPSARGAGVGRSLMTAYLQELNQAGVALCALYASTRSLYRSVGFGTGGSVFTATFPTAALRGIGDRSGAWRPIEADDWGTIEARYADQAPAHPGSLDRGPYIWDRVRSYRGTPTHGWVLEDAGELRAWLVIRQSPGNPWLTVHIIDRWAADITALRQLAGLLGSFSAMARTVSMPAAAVDPLLDLMGERSAELKLFEPWMLRVTDLGAAFEQRGWPAGLDTCLDVDIADPLIQGNHGRHRVRIHRGSARVQPGGDGTIALSSRGLASLYSGYASPWDLRLLGELHAPPEQLHSLAAAFSAPLSRLRDHF